MRMAMSFLSKNIQSLNSNIYIYIRLEIYKNKKKKEPNCVFLLAAGAEIAAKFSSSPAENWYSLFFLHIFHGVDNDVFVYCD